MSFTGLIGIGAIICYILGIIFDNVGWSALALGLTIYAIKFGGI